jgi:hypothetical protein
MSPKVKIFNIQELIYQIMTDSIKSIEFLGDYLKSLFEKRKDNHFEDSMKNPIIEGEETALTVFVHAASICYWGAKLVIDPTIDQKELRLELDPSSTKPLYEQLLDMYEVAKNSFIEARSKYKEEELGGSFKRPWDGKDMKLDDWFGFIIHHTIGHIYQAMRLQAIYLRRKL